MPKRQNALFLGYMLSFAAVYFASVAYGLIRLIFNVELFGSNVVVNQQAAGVQQFAAQTSLGLIPIFIIVLISIALLVFLSFRAFKKANRETTRIMIEKEKLDKNGFQSKNSPP